MHSTRICRALFLDRDLWTFPNILAGRRIIPEFIQSEFTVENVAGEALAIIRDEGAAGRQRVELKELRDLLYRPDCLERSAQLVVETAEKGDN